MMLKKNFYHSVAYSTSNSRDWYNKNNFIMNKDYCRGLERGGGNIFKYTSYFLKKKIWTYLNWLKLKFNNVSNQIIKRIKYYKTNKMRQVKNSQY